MIARIHFTYCIILPIILWQILTFYRKYTHNGYNPHLKIKKHHGGIDSKWQNKRPWNSPRPTNPSEIYHKWNNSHRTPTEH